MTLPSFTASLGPPSTTPMPVPVDGPLADSLLAAPIDDAIGGFAAALDEATATLDLLTVGALDGAIPSPPGTGERPPPALPAETQAPAAGVRPTAPPAAVAAASEAVLVDAGSDVMGHAPVWPPPGLSSLFPASSPPTTARPTTRPLFSSAGAELPPVDVRSDTAAREPGPPPTGVSALLSPTRTATTPPMPSAGGANAPPVELALDASRGAPAGPPTALASRPSTILPAPVLPTPSAGGANAPPVELALDASRGAPAGPPTALASRPSTILPAPVLPMPSAGGADAPSALPALASPRGLATIVLPVDVAGGSPPGLASPSFAPTPGVATPQPAASPTPSPSPVGPDVPTAAMAPKALPLHSPVTEEEDSALFAVPSETLVIDRAPDVVPALPASTAPGLHKLDLAQAFPAPVPLPSPRFADEVGARLQWIAEQQGGEATLRISPDGLGPVEIRLKLDGDRVELGFTATQQDTRQALQDALPKLREMLAQQGLQLGHADVGQKHSQSSNDEAGKASAGRPQDDDGEAIVLSSPIQDANVVNGRARIGVLDLYA